MRVGIFGGSFDPVHKGHQTLVHQLKKALSLDKVFIVPAFVSPFKQNNPPIATPEERVALLKAAFEDDPDIEILLLEIERGGPSFTIDTIKELKKRYPNDTFFLLLSKEMIPTLSLWKDIEDIKNLVTIVFGGVKKSTCQYGEIFPVDQLPISSTKIRREGPHAFIEYLDPKVMDYIEKYHLYY